MAQVDAFDLPDELYYDRKEHLWARLEAGKVRVGLDQFGQKMTSDGMPLTSLTNGTDQSVGGVFRNREQGEDVQHDCPF